MEESTGDGELGTEWTLVGAPLDCSAIACLHAELESIVPSLGSAGF
jgi:hypothetical protein